MDIHKPKPWHNWREFLKELATIVLGILIALSLEALVENWREKHQHSEARQAVRAELAYDVSSIKRRSGFATCITARIAEIDGLLNRAESGQPFTAPNWIGSAVSLRQRFAAEPEVGNSALFSSSEQRDFSRLYSYLHSFDTEQDRERLAWGRLQMLQGRGHLSAEMIQALREALADAGYENDRIAFLVVWAQSISRNMVLPDISTDVIFSVNLRRRNPHCVPMSTPAVQARRDTDLTPLIARLPN